MFSNHNGLHADINRHKAMPLLSPLLLLTSLFSNTFFPSLFSSRIGGKAPLSPFHLTFLFQSAFRKRPQGLTFSFNKQMASTENGAGVSLMTRHHVLTLLVAVYWQNYIRIQLQDKSTDKWSSMRVEGSYFGDNVLK